MRIPRDFDRWMFDYKEGNLSQAENSYFENYMSENPQLNSDVEAWDNSYVRKEVTAYPGISSLQKESKLKLYSSWAAVGLLFLISMVGSYNLLNQSDSLQYSLRQTKLNLLPAKKVLPFALNQKQHAWNKSANNETSIASNPANNLTTYPISNNTLGSTIENGTAITHTNSPLLKKIELNKINNSLNSENNSAQYLNNPTFKESKLKSTKTKSKRKSSKTLLRSLKSGFRKIEKRTGYPIGIINLKDPEFITPAANLFNINPGFVGANGSSRFESKYRTQWLGSENNLQTTTLNFDTYFKSIRGGIGVSLNTNNFNNGLLTDNTLNFIYSPKFAVTKKIIFEPALKLSLGIMTIDQEKTNTDNTFEIQRGQLVKTHHSNDIFTANNLWYKDYGVGFVLNSEIFYFGVNADNLAKHKQTIYGQDSYSSVNYTAIFGLDYQSKSKNMIFSPFITYQNNSSINELWAGANIKYYWLTLGGGYSSKNDFSAAIGIKTSNFKLSYQYDMTETLLSDRKMGSHSIGLRINTKRKH